MKPKRKYTEPKIYSVGIEVSKWSKYSNSEKEKALKKQWFVYFSFRNSKIDLLEKQSFIKDGVNHYKTKEERFDVLETFKKNLSKILRMVIIHRNRTCKS